MLFTLTTLLSLDHHLYAESMTMMVGASLLYNSVIHCLSAYACDAFVVFLSSTHPCVSSSSFLTCCCMHNYTIYKNSNLSNSTLWAIQKLHPTRRREAETCPNILLYVYLYVIGAVLYCTCMHMHAPSFPNSTLSDVQSLYWK